MPRKEYNFIDCKRVRICSVDMELLKIGVCGKFNGLEVMSQIYINFFLLYHIMIRSRAQLGTYHKEGPSQLRSIVASFISFLFVLLLDRSFSTTTAFSH